MMRYLLRYEYLIEFLKKEMNMTRYQNDRDFEEDVRHIADALFELEPGTCKAEILSSENGKDHEIDGVVRTRDVVHLIMATRSTRLNKVKEDVSKLNSVSKKINDTCKLWMVVLEEPEAPHVTHAKTNNVTLLSYNKFKEKLFDGRKYLSKRKDSPFGSARNPKDNSINISDDEYIDPPMINMENGSEIKFSDIIKRLRRGDCLILVGPFGTGKSLTLKELWGKFRKDYLRNRAEIVPLAINLREHWGAQYPDEILRRHGRSIGFEKENEIIAAWRAGMTMLFIDGFDEVASQGLSTPGSIELMRETRKNSLSAVRGLLSIFSPNLGILITGRDHYFDSRSEMESALGLQQRKFTRIFIEEFDTPRAIEYCKRKGIRIELPDWLPKKPLLLGYLAREDFLEEVLSIDGSNGQACAWISFLDRICRRESNLDRATMEVDTVKRILENLAIRVRSTPNGTGPISSSMLSEIFLQVTGTVPNDSALLQLQRLPGLTERDVEPGLRSFVDPDFLQTLQGAALSRWLLEGGVYNSKIKLRDAFRNVEEWLEQLGGFASIVALEYLRKESWTFENLKDFILKYSDSQFGADLLGIMLMWAGEEENTIDLSGITLSGVNLREINLDEYTILNLTLKDSIIKEVIIGGYAKESSLSVVGSHVVKISGVGNIESMPSNIILEKCNKDIIFERLQTTNAILNLELDDNIKSLLTALKKLYRQSGSGRVGGAFKRGVPSNIVKLMDPMLKLLLKENFAKLYRGVYYPVRSNTKRANQILDNPFNSNDIIIQKAREIH